MKARTLTAIIVLGVVILGIAATIIFLKVWTCQHEDPPTNRDGDEKEWASLPDTLTIPTLNLPTIEELDRETERIQRELEEQMEKEQQIIEAILQLQGEIP